MTMASMNVLLALAFSEGLRPISSPVYGEDYLFDCSARRHGRRAREDRPRSHASRDRVRGSRESASRQAQMPRNAEGNAAVTVTVAVCVAGTSVLRPLMSRTDRCNAAVDCSDAVL